MTSEVAIPSLKPPTAPDGAARGDDAVDARAMEKAREFEAVFIAQMLKFSGMDKALTQNSGFGGDAFSTMMLEQYAQKIIDNGGFGLADQIYEQLRDKEA
ncbi:MAG: rod-binding protein [Hyphococcus sp.]